MGRPSEPVAVADLPLSSQRSQPAKEKQAITEPRGEPETKPVETKPPKEKPPRKEPPVVKPPSEDKPPPPPSPPPVEETKEIALADDLPPELEFQIVDAINTARGKAGLGPIFLDAESSRSCQEQADRLARNPSRQTAPAAERSKETLAADEPLAAIAKWLTEPARRSLILEPRLRTVGAGFARNVVGQWFSVFDWSRGIDPETMEAGTVTGAVAYPAPRQTRVPLGFPGNETPDPVPEAANKLAGYPITLLFPPPTRIESVTAHLSNKDERDIALWLSWPEKPANPRYPDLQPGTISLIAKRPLKPDTRYLVEVTARVNGAEWSAKWSFTTVCRGEIHYEMAGTLLRTLNTHRRRAGLQPIRLDAERSKACAAHARYLGTNAPRNPALQWNAEKPELPGYTKEGEAIARTASIQGGGGPVEAVTGLVDSLISRPQLLDPHLHALGVGYTPFVHGGWIWVMDLQRKPGREIRKELLYPAPDQKDVPLVYPADEVPSPIPPQNKGKGAGYAITAEFGFGVKVIAASAKLVNDKGEAVSGWLSSPEKRAIAEHPQRSICLLPQAPLKPATRYMVTFSAQVDGQPWQRTWSFTTIQEPNRFADGLDEKILRRVNAARKAAGLHEVRLDTELSHGCQSHARYLSVNANHPAAQGMRVHEEDVTLPGATPEGAQAAKRSVIAVIVDPQTCVDGWMATLYHRISILAPDLERIGFGHARISGRKWACVLDTLNGRTRR